MPRLGALRALPAVSLSGKAPSAQGATAWELRHGVAFSAGALIALIALASLTYLLPQLRQIAAMQDVRQRIGTDDPSQWSAGTAHDRWVAMRELGLRQPGLPQQLVQIRTQLRILTGVACLCLALGIGAVVWAVVPRRKRQPVRPASSQAV